MLGKNEINKSKVTRMLLRWNRSFVNSSRPKTRKMGQIKYSTGRRSIFVSADGIPAS